MSRYYISSSFSLPAGAHDLDDMIIQTFKILNSMDDLNANDFYECNTNNTRDNDIKLTIKFCSTNNKKFSFSYRTARHWNTLTTLTRRAESLYHFKVFLDQDDNTLVKE